MRILAAILVLACSAVDLVRCAEVANSPELVDVYTGGAEGYRVFRIPSVVVSRKGTLLAFCEGRKFSGSDETPTDLVLKRSIDGGKTWTPLMTLVRAVPEAAMDPCAVVDRTDGKIFLLYDRWPELAKDRMRKDHRRAAGLGRDSITGWVVTSTDDGLTWSEPRDITASTKRAEWTEIIHGPGVGIQTRSGRLVVPCNYHHKGNRSFVICSDDRGRSWQLGGETGPGVDESQVVELADGRLMLNMRSYRGKHCRAVSYSADGGKTWSEVTDVPELVERPTQGSILRYTLAGPQDKNRLLFCNPADPSQRVNLTVRISYDEGRTWPVSRTLYAGSGLYSCLTVLPGGTIGCLFERDNCRTISFARFSLEWLSSGSDRLTFSRP